jgi:hypothetical protein
MMSYTISDHPSDFSSGRLSEVARNKVNYDTIKRINRITAGDVESSSDQLEGWWFSNLEARNIHGFDSPTHHLVSSGNRVFRGGIKENFSEDDIWDVSDMLIEVIEQERRREQFQSAMLEGVSVPAMPRFDTPQGWLATDRGNGFVLIHRTDGSNGPIAIPCRLTTTAKDICLQLGVAVNVMHVVYGGLNCRRLDPQECPLAILNDYLAGLGHTAITDIQEEGISTDLEYLIKFYSGEIFMHLLSQSVLLFVNDFHLNFSCGIFYASYIASTFNVHLFMMTRKYHSGGDDQDLVIMHTTILFVGGLRL